MIVYQSIIYDQLWYLKKKISLYVFVMIMKSGVLK